MKTVKIPRRKQEIHQSDDGRRIEQWIKDGEIEDTLEDGEELEVAHDGDMFVGVLHLFTAAGPKEIKFEIPAKDVDEAFGNFKECAKKTMEDLQKQMEQAQQEQANQIIVPGGPAEAANQLHV
tara:strand:- start:1980 stop:2348 length:369 start_codon:yes stop_codon:yes gene_type:complete